MIPIPNRLLRACSAILVRKNVLPLSSLSSPTSNQQDTQNPLNPPPIPQPTTTHKPKSGPRPSSRTKTPLEKEFNSWVHKLTPGFGPEEVDEVLRSQIDPDLAFDIFRWTAQQRNYKHTHRTYETIITISFNGKRFDRFDALVDEVMAGACSGSFSLFNTIISSHCRRNHLNRAIDVFKKMQKFPDCRATLETYTTLLVTLLRKFYRVNICYAYLHTVRSLLKHMNASGVIPDILTLNLIIKAYSRCLQMDEAIRIFREMSLYKCEPNSYTYSYITKGLCEKGRISQAVSFYEEMREKGFVPSSSTYMALICSLALEGRLDDGIEVMFHMLNNSMAPDFLTYKTVLEGLGREGREEEAFRLLEELRKKEDCIDEKTYSNLLDCLYLLERD
ncbi:pentatricopeptide repeat-containing protein At3g25210, mitochondrial [Nymphaea colorata]|uniref:Pentacotripeptide-repeat region of PRORP domain-containing protein n=1 Tax=Nymphaea colorata TaxID=210225 RepID=A0A5K1C0Y9_9MAGN|nr:pentatricopeptide repeat-containing protein At3g25210, mitochondrial [Nymphaea colorata]